MSAPDLRTGPTCRVCGTSQKIHATRFTFARHPGPDGLPCPGSGRTRAEVDDALRTFDCWENTDTVKRRTLVNDEGDSVSVINTLSARGVEVGVTTRLLPADVVRLRDELDLIIRKWGWRGDMSTGPDFTKADFSTVDYGEIDGQAGPSRVIDDSVRKTRRGES